MEKGRKEMRGNKYRKKSFQEFCYKREERSGGRESRLASFCRLMRTFRAVEEGLKGKEGWVEQCEGELLMR